MKNNKVLVVISAFVFCTSCCATGYLFQSGNLLKTNNASNFSDQINFQESNTNENQMKFRRNINSIDFSELIFTPWDTTAASEQVIQRNRKPYTIMIYMNGSDLESESGAATLDLIEMLESGLNSDNVNLIVFTGGTNRWQNDLIPENTCMIWEIENGLIYETSEIGLVNMGDPGTLSSFINFSIDNFPADRYGLVLWDHGGGSIAGYGSDEKFQESNLTLLDLNFAFEQSLLKENNLEFLGFDSCLMNSVEMAVVASNYAKYLIASEDLEPGDGWDYSFLASLNENPQINGAELGIEITDYFMDYYGDSNEILTMSVIDLSQASKVMNAMGNLMNLCSSRLNNDSLSTFRTLARKRNGTKTFGEGSPRDNDCDMVDIGDMAYKLYDLFPNEAEAVLAALDDAVIYNRHNSNTNLKGLSTYYIYGGQTNGNTSLDVYAALGMADEYTDYLNNFYNLLVGKNTTRTKLKPNESSIPLDEIVNRAVTLWQPLKERPGHMIMTGIKSDVNTETYHNALWPTINGKNICLHQISSFDKGEFYAVPITLNGQDCDIIILICEKYPEGKILGTRKEDGIIIQKGLDPIKKGDKLCFYYKESAVNADVATNEINWYLSDEIIIEKEAKLEWLSLQTEENYIGLYITDIRHNEYYLTEF